MPQPLSKVMPKAMVMFGNAGDAPLQRHPALAVLALEAISSWSNVESFLLKMFVQLFGGDKSLATNIFLSLKNNSAKTAAVNAVAKIVLKDKPDELAVFKVIIAISKTNEKSRNKLAHWTWGDSPHISDGLLLINPKSIIGDLDKSEIYVYKESDFTSIIESNDKLCGYGLLFNQILRGCDHDGSRLTCLKEEPEIKKRLSDWKS